MAFSNFSSSTAFAASSVNSVVSMSATARLGFVPKDHSALRGDRTGTALADQAPTATDTSLPDPASEEAGAPDPLKSAVVEARLANAVAQVSYARTVLQISVTEA